mmetsp:Transcript_38371/g.91011  ORF Transcript_38371/g.91011 Transcript_38371/m.91011 type:complete len:110 (+) Transcript_38371:556-885(+)
METEYSQRRSLLDGWLHGKSVQPLQKYRVSFSQGLFQETINPSREKELYTVIFQQDSVHFDIRLALSEPGNSLPFLPRNMNRFPRGSYMVLLRMYLRQGKARAKAAAYL